MPHKTSIAVRCLLVGLSLGASCGLAWAQGFFSDWPQLHTKDLSKWAAKTGLSYRFLNKLTETATHVDANELEKGYFWYFVENVDTKTLSKERHILLSTWAAGTGHCMTLYVLKRVGSQFQKVWESTENLCTESILGAATSQATRDGQIIVRFREHSESFDPDKEDAPRVLKVEITYKWDGSTYVNAGRNRLPETQE
jgi:hypothetical protein